MLNLTNLPIFKSERNDIKAFVISLENNTISQNLTKRCVESLNNVKMPYEIWYGLDGTDGKNIVIPEHLKNKEYLSWLKRANSTMSTSEIALFLTHFSLWSHCCTINEPIVILEHDAVMIKPYTYHKHINTINFLGHEVQLNKENTHIVWYFIKDSYYFIPCAHAYAIDPPAARNLVSHAIKYGITCPADNFMRMDVFSIVQDDLYAHQISGESIVQHS
jgi:GR25 family glycosyltransferase involved in LPS biosynthesis